MSWTGGDGLRVRAEDEGRAVSWQEASMRVSARASFPELKQTGKHGGDESTSVILIFYRRMHLWLRLLASTLHPHPHSSLPLTPILPEEIATQDVGVAALLTLFFWGQLDCPMEIASLSFVLAIY